MRIKDFNKLKFKSQIELFWCDGEEVLELIKSLIEFVQDTNDNDKVYFMLKGEFSAEDYQYYPDDLSDSSSGDVISEWDDEYSYADVGDCTKDFFDETQPVIDAVGSIYSVDIEEHSTKTFKFQTLEYLNKLYDKYNNEYEQEEDIEIDPSELWYGLMVDTQIQSASFWCDEANQAIKWCRAFEIEEDIYSVFIVENDSELIFIKD